MKFSNNYTDDLTEFEDDYDYDLTKDVRHLLFLENKRMAYHQQQWKKHINSDIELEDYMLPSSKTGRDMEDLIALKIAFEELLPLLTDKQREFISLLEKGYNLTEMSKFLGISDKAVAARREGVIKKLVEIMEKHGV